MIVITDKKDLLVAIDELKRSEKKITLIPTMGNLHEGHKTLIKYAPRDTFKVATIYVNPLQFNDRDDYTNYPRSIERDINLCKELNIDLVYAPELDITTEIDIENKIDLPKFTSYLCGATRKNHFQGVYTIVKYLFSIIKPDYACFGKKDYQQLVLIKFIVSTFFQNLKIIEVDTVRLNNIALSSRLSRLDEKTIRDAQIMFKSLIKIREQLLKGDKFSEIKDSYVDEIEKLNFNVEYLEHRNNDTLEIADNHLSNSSIFIACNVKNVRLIDNIQI